ncbi:MAG TPA: acetyl-CoA carboxylase biotin carboxyl carrier protein subunit [Oligoflexia bacterium]|nr:acetyl-CoA carboxylase biotin carboxyl carrier protein subunit [Oligoflexia bacterium]
MKYWVTCAGSEQLFDELESGVRTNAKVDRFGSFTRVGLDQESCYFGVTVRSGSMPGERRVLIACGLGNIEFGIERGVGTRSDAQGSTGSKILKSSMPGRIVRVLCKPGDRVSAGQPLLVLEAMKMENEIAASVSGLIEKVAVTADQKIETGEILLTIDAGSASKT